MESKIIYNGTDLTWDELMNKFENKGYKDTFIKVNEKIEFESDSFIISLGNCELLVNGEKVYMFNENGDMEFTKEEILNASEQIKNYGVNKSDIPNSWNQPKRESKIKVTPELIEALSPQKKIKEQHTIANGINPDYSRRDSNFD